MDKRFLIIIVAILTIALGSVAYKKLGNKPQPKPTAPTQVVQPELPKITPTKPEPTKPEPTKPEVVPEPKKYQEALEASRKTGKKVLVLFTAPNWCPPCQRMERETLPDPKVKEALKTYIFYKLDIDKEEKDVAVRWKVKGVPALLITNAEEKLIKSTSGFKSPTELIQWLGN
jgi:thiol:disulfide interchange protein